MFGVKENERRGELGFGEFDLGRWPSAQVRWQRSE
jgi:hypothetical protein